MALLILILTMRLVTVLGYRGGALFRHRRAVPSAPSASTLNPAATNPNPNAPRQWQRFRPFHATRAPPLYSSNANAPPVEVSPSDHGTTAMKDFPSASALDRRITRTLQSPSMNITAPTPIQSHAIPLLLNNHDVMASSATGSGKTLMFSLPLLNQLLDIGEKASSKGNAMGRPDALVISPTRELAAQTADVLNGFAKGDASLRSRINVSLATGGSDTRDQRRLLPKCNVLVGTPGRICQFLDERKLTLQSVSYLVIDEADRLLDLGFERELTRIARSLGRNGQQQSILCSATFPAGVQRLAADFLDPKYYFVSVGKVGSTHSSIKQRFEYINLYGGKSRNGKNSKVDAVVRNVKQFWDGSPAKDQSSVLVFTNTKDGAELYGKALSKELGTKNRSVRVIHGDKPQSERNDAIRSFKSGKVKMLVATDIAARGLDVNSIGLVVQAEAPRNVDTYTHRIGRTGRAGRSGLAVTLLDSKSGFGIASGLVNLLLDAGMKSNIPSWLQGMAHIANARSQEEDMKIQAGSFQNDASSTAVPSEINNEEFSHQDFRRTAAKDSYGMGKDTAYRDFDEEAYSSEISSVQSAQSTTVSGSESSIAAAEVRGDGLETPTIAEEVAAIDAEGSFERMEPSKRLLRAVAEIDGSADIGYTPDKSILDALGRRDQLLRFEYIGLFPFRSVSPLLMSTRSRDSNRDKVKILMVAEKPSIAKSIADALSGKRGPAQRRGVSRALPVYEFTTDKFLPAGGKISDERTKCLVRVTSVVGHVYSLGFDDARKKEERTQPKDYFNLPVTKKEENTSSKLRVVDHLRALAGDSDHLVLWLDCDPEGENIAHEVMAVTRRAIHSNSNDDTTRIHRAKFSAITPTAIRDAFSSLEEPDADLSRSVDARQELDLRIGVALTRLLTWRCVHVARKRFSPSTRMISYGPCQTPALSFCVDRLRDIEEFQSQQYFKVGLEAKLSDGNSYPITWKVSDDDAVEDTRGKFSRFEECATFDKRSARDVVDRAHGSKFIVKALATKSETTNPPVGLNTVAMLEAGSKAMGMSPKSVMNVAEKLYSAGYISYPRTETTRYDPNGFDARSMLRDHSNHPDWGRSAAYLLRIRKSNKPPLRGKDAGDHPPITPLKSASRDEIFSQFGGAAWRLYDFVVRHFIGSLHNELVFTRTIASLALPNTSESEFELELVAVESPGFTDVCRWVWRDIGVNSFGRNNDENQLQEGQLLEMTKAAMEEKKTRPPRFLQEHELIRLMDSNRIGTDASMAVHVSNIVDRNYVMLCDETGVPLRPPLPPNRRKKNLPRQIGRYMVPTPLGVGLLDLFGHTASLGDFESPAMLSHPSIRKSMEEEVKEIAKGNIEKDFCLEKNLNWFEDRYSELEQSLTREYINGDFAKNLGSAKEYLRYLQSLGAFEPKLSMPKKHQSVKKPNPTQQKGTLKKHGKQGRKQFRRRREVTQ